MSTTESYKIGVFYITGNVILLGDYPEQESIEYLKKFIEVKFSYDEGVQSIGFQLQIPHKNRLANIYLYNLTASEVIQRFNEGKKTDPLGAFQLKLSYDGKTDIWPLF
jgi:hypothetical protein